MKTRTGWRPALLLILAVASFDALQAQRTMNGFNLEGASIPISSIESGGPPRDGIPALDQPRFTTAAEAPWLSPQDRVLGLAEGNEARAYPIAILDWHEVVNDRIGGRPVVVTYCPLCGSGMAFSARAAGRALNFGVSGLLYNSDVLLYDRQSESLWSQILGKAISGPRRGTRLEQIPLEHTTWGDWRARRPHSLVMSRDTGYRRDYGRSPYLGYADSPRIWFALSHRDPRRPAKEWVLGVEIDGVHRAYPFGELAKQPRVEERVAGRELVIGYDPEHRSAVARGADGRAIPSVTAFWFAWAAFHPDTQVFRATAPDPRHPPPIR